LEELELIRTLPSLYPRLMRRKPEVARKLDFDANPESEE
jgi:hypothetical protein